MSAPAGAAWSERPGKFMARPDSVPIGIVEHRLWKPFGPTKKDAWRFVDAVKRAAKQLDYDTKMPGDRMGEFGDSGIKVLEALFSFSDHMSGRMEPSIAALAAKAKLARGTVWRALKRLQEGGIISWVRRKQYLDNDGAGPQVHQATNAYFFKLRGRVAGLVRLWLNKFIPPVPDDAVARGEQDREATETMLGQVLLEEAARFLVGHTPLGDALAALGRSMDNSANSIKGRNPESSGKI
ncbi:MAG: hypothetical protein QOH47_786 [Sphingomonadales bacterium]|jgi:hypothetical protein|nr:hypothetical protein [Sphingomonadales bacterium]